MRRPTLIAIIVLFALLIAAGVYQLVLATRDSPPLPAPVSPGQLPSLPPSHAS